MAVLSGSHARVRVSDSHLFGHLGGAGAQLTACARAEPCARCSSARSPALRGAWVAPRSRPRPPLDAAARAALCVLWRTAQVGPEHVPGLLQRARTQGSKWLTWLQANTRVRGDFESIIEVHH